MKVNVARAQFARKVERQNAQRSEMVQYAVALGCFVCRRKWKFGKKRLNRLVKGAFLEMTDYYEHYGGEPNGILDPEQLPTLYSGLRNQIRCLEIPVEEIEEQNALSAYFRNEWRSGYDREKRKARYEEAQSLVRVTRAWWYSMLLHLWHTYGNGAGVLGEIYREVQRNWRITMNLYLNCRDEDDMRVLTTVKDTKKAIEDLGVDLN